MGKALKLEFRKFKQSKSFFFCLLALLLGAALSILLIYAIDVNLDADIVYTGTELAMEAVSSSVIILVMAVFTSIFVCSDYADGSLKTVFSRGVSRGSYYWAKFIVLAISTLVMFVLVVAVNFGLGLVLWERGDLPSKDMILALLAQYGIILGITAIYQFFAHLFTKIGAAIPVNILFLSVASLAVTFVDYIFDLGGKIIKYLPETALGYISTDLIVKDDLVTGAISGIAFIVVFAIAGAITAGTKEV